MFFVISEQGKVGDKETEMISSSFFSSPVLDYVAPSQSFLKKKERWKMMKKMKDYERTEKKEVLHVHQWAI